VREPRSAITFNFIDGKSTAPNHSQPPFPQSQRPRHPTGQIPEEPTETHQPHSGFNRAVHRHIDNPPGKRHFRSRGLIKGYFSDGDGQGRVEAQLGAGDGVLHVKDAALSDGREGLD